MDCDVFIVIGMLDIRCGLDVGTGETSLDKRNAHNVGKKTACTEQTTRTLIKLFHKAANT